MSENKRPFWMLPNRESHWRNCPTCNNLMEYDHKGTRNRANRNRSSCQSCAITVVWERRRSLKKK